MATSSVGSQPKNQIRARGIVRGHQTNDDGVWRVKVGNKGNELGQIAVSAETVSLAVGASLSDAGGFVCFRLRRILGEVPSPSAQSDLSAGGENTCDCTADNVQ